MGVGGLRTTGFAARGSKLRSGMTNGRFDWFLLVAWLPPLALAAVFAYVAGYEGWGRWSAAPLLLLPVFLALPITLAGLVRIRAERAAGRIRGATLLSTTVAALPLAWFLWRLVVSR